MIGIDLFSGAGGMSLGAHYAGVTTVLAVEADPYAAATYKLNFPTVQMINDDICSIQQIDVDHRNQQTVLYGGPPCQGFSTSNQRTRSASNPRNWLFQEFLRCATLWQPDWIVFENVKGIAETEKGLFLEIILENISRLGYTPVASTLNASDYGVPQKRHRLFVVASRHGIKFQMPEPITFEPISVQDAFCQLPELGNGASDDVMGYYEGNASDYAKLMRGNLQTCSGHIVTRNANYVIDRYAHIPQGGNWQNIPEAMMTNYADRNRCHTGIYHRLEANAPSVVIGNYRKNMLVHPFQNRGLSVREAARLQSFPDWFRFTGSIGFKQQQVGNAVPPLLAKVIFQSLINCVR